VDLKYIILKFQDVWVLIWSDGKHLPAFRKIVMPSSLGTNNLRRNFESEVGNRPIDFIKSWDFIMKRDITKSSNNSIAELVGDRERLQQENCGKTR
jgi:hypothetical protein